MAELEAHDSVEAMAEAYARKAVQQASEYTAKLDYSENSLKQLEIILEQVASKVRSLVLTSDELGEICKTWGSYFGEVVRRRFGGEWSIETYPGKQFATLTLSINGNKLFPSMKIHRRLAQGGDESIWSFYNMVKVRLERTPGARMQ